ncbi:replication initiator [Streptomyces sp. NPDC057623]|uniref:replication initiator n=1 Tax=Streptomyces sp. NPDC057623 TaxID=3346187 RepID=UPI0036C200FE
MSGESGNTITRPISPSGTSSDPAGRSVVLAREQRVQAPSEADRDLGRLIRDPLFSRWKEQIKSIGGCAHPIYLSGSTVTRDAVTGEVLSSCSTDGEPGERLAVRCRNRRASVCEPCAYLHAGDTFQLVRAGLSGGKGVPDTVRDRPLLFVTLTAPSFGLVHRVRDGERCRPRRDDPRCEHGRRLGCGLVHTEDAPAVGLPLCPDCYDYVGHVLWHAHAGRLWDRFTTSVRRYLASAGGVPRSKLGDHLVVSFAKVAEFQRRAAVHFHAVVRMDGPDGPSSSAPDWATEDVRRLVEESLGTVPQRAESYRRRLAELDDQIEKKRASRKRKIALLLASVSDDQDDDDDAKLVEEMKAELKQQEADLVAERERVAEWLCEVEGQEGRAQHMLAKIEKVDGRLDDFTFEQKQDVLDLLDVRVQITGKGEPRHKGVTDPIAEWHRETGVTIPVEITDEQWREVERIVSPSRQWKDVRGGFDAMLDKIRSGKNWKDYDRSERIGGRGWAALYRRAQHWWGNGEYEGALAALAPYEGVAPPPLYVLPPMEVTGTADPEYTAERAGRGGSDSEWNHAKIGAEVSPR